MNRREEKQTAGNCQEHQREERKKKKQGQKSKDKKHMYHSWHNGQDMKQHGEILNCFTLPTVYSPTFESQVAGPESERKEMQWRVESNVNAVKGAKESLKLSASLSFSHVFLLALPLSLSLKQRGNIQCR